MLSYNGAKDAGIFGKRGIEVEVDARPFAGFMARLPAGRSSSAPTPVLTPSSR